MKRSASDDDVCRNEVAAAHTYYGMSDLKENDVLFVADSGATSHTTYSYRGTINKRENDVECLGATGEGIKTSLVDLPGQFIEEDGQLGLETLLTDVHVNETYNFNLLSLTRLIMNGWEISGRKDCIIATKGDMMIKFDIVIKTASGGALFACRFCRTEGDIAAANADDRKKISVQKAHEMFGHLSEDITRNTARALGMELTRGALKTCISCAEAKAKQKNVPKKTYTPKCTIPGERMNLDISTVTVSKQDNTLFRIKNKYWVILADEATGKKLAEFVATKKSMPERICELISKLKAKGITVKVVRMDNAGENKALHKKMHSNEWKMFWCEVEYTAPNTPQQNSRAETSFTGLSGRARAMMNAANIPNGTRGKVGIEALKTAVQLDGLVPVTINGRTATRDEHFFGDKPSFVKGNALRVFGEMGIVKNEKKRDKRKLGDRGTRMMFIGYPDNAYGDAYKMWNPITNKVIVSRNIIWANRMFYQPIEEEIEIVIPPDNTTTSNNKQEAEKDDDQNESDNDVEEVPDGANEEREEEEIEFADDAVFEDVSDDEDDIEEEEERSDEEGEEAQTVPRSRYGRAIKRNERLIESMGLSCDSTAAERNYAASLQEINNEELETIDEVMCVGAGIGGGFANTSELTVLNYNQAMKGPRRAEWRKEVKNEYDRMMKFNALKRVKKKDLPRGAKVMSTTWAMKQKSNGKLRARLNARGFQQIDGLHYASDSTSSPVTNATSVRIVLTLLAMNKDWIAEIVDVEGAFLQGEFTDGEEIFISIPQGFEDYYDKDEVLQLLVPLYGTKQAALCFYKKLVQEIQDRQYERSKADPCLYYCWKYGRLVVMLSWIDDNLIAGHPRDVEQLKQDLMNAFQCKEEGALNEYVGSKIERVEDSDGVAYKFTQPVLITKLKEENGLSRGKIPQTPAKPGQVLIKGNGALLLGAAATRYRSLTATMMFMMQWSRPDIYNAVRSLARHMHAPTEEHNAALHYCMKYVVSTPERGLVLRPEGTWNGDKKYEFVVHGRSDSDYAGNTDDRRSISGGTVTVNGAHVIFRSATQRFVTLSVTEAETAAGVMVAQDMMYVYRVLTSIGLRVRLPMVLELDNKGAVDLANNFSVGGRTRHMDVRNHFLRELKAEGLVVIRHVSGDDNEADIFTKNTATHVFNKHIVKFVGNDAYIGINSE